MLLLDSARTIDVDGVTVFPDHADDNQFWCLGGPVGLRKGPDGRPRFSLIKYKRTDAQATDGGFAMFEVALQLDDELRTRIISELRRFAAEPRLSSVQFIDGTVECIALNLQGGGGTAAETPPPGGFAAVRKILGARKPELFGDNGAAFSLELDPEGAAILEAAFSGGQSPLGVVFNFTFVGLSKALEITLTADLNRVYQYFGGSLTGRYMFAEASISAGLEKLRQDRVIDLQIHNFSTDDDRQAQEDAALALFKDQLMADWFLPSLTLGAAHAASNASSSRPATPAASGNTSTDNESDTDTDASAGSGSGSGDGRGTNTQADDTTENRATPTPSAVVPRTSLPAANLSIATPENERDGVNIELVQGGTGTRHRLRISGATNSTVTVDGSAAVPDASGNIEVDLPPGTSKSIRINRPASPERTETFRLFFDKDEPRGESGTLTSQQSSRYIQGIPNEPDDERFLASRAPGRSGTARGRQALQSWVQDRLILINNRRVIRRLHAHASFETDEPGPVVGRPSHDQHLSERRLAVAAGILGDVDIDERQAFGHTEAASENRLDDPADRFAEIVGVTSASAPELAVVATVSRPEAPEPVTPPVQPETPPEEEPTTPPEEPEEPDEDEDDSSDKPDLSDVTKKAEVVFELKFLRQEERKTVTYNYTRSAAVKRTHHPQGFFELLLDGVDPSQHFLEVDNDDPFFRDLSLTLQGPNNPGAIDLISTNVGVDYGDPADPPNHRFDDHTFDESNTADWKPVFNFNASNDIHYAYTVAYRFASGGDWEGTQLVYQFNEANVTRRTLPLSPYEHLDFHELDFVADQIDWDAVLRIEVSARLQDNGGTLVQRFDLTASGESHDWKVRLEKDTVLALDITIVTVLQNGERLATRSVQSDRSTIAISDGLPHALDLAFLVPLASQEFNSIFVDVIYKDVENGINRRIERELSQGDTRLDLHIAVLDPDKRSYDVTFTFIDLTAGTRTTRSLTGVVDDVLLVTPG